MCGDMNGGGDQHVDFPQLRETKIGEKEEANSRQSALLELRYDLGNRSGSAVMSRGKPVQTGARTRLPEGVTPRVLRCGERWDVL